MMVLKKRALKKLLNKIYVESEPLESSNIPKAEGLIVDLPSGLEVESASFLGQLWLMKKGYPLSKNVRLSEEDYEKAIGIRYPTALSELETFYPGIHDRVVLSGDVGSLQIIKTVDHIYSIITASQLIESLNDYCLSFNLIRERLKEIADSL